MSRRLSTMVTICKNLSSTITLNDGNTMPMFGLGMFLSKSGSGGSAEKAVTHALKNGYKMIDTAEFYGNESDVGQGIKASGLKREDYFIVTKVWTNGSAQCRSAFTESLKKLDISYVDLYLIHSPSGGKIVETYKTMMEFQKQGLIKSIGVSNFGVHHLQGMKEAGLPTPTVNQIELHPWMKKKDIVQYCQANNITVMGYSPLVKGQRFKEPCLMEVAKRIPFLRILVHGTPVSFHGKGDHSNVTTACKGILAPCSTPNPPRLYQHVVTARPILQKIRWTDNCHIPGICADPKLRDHGRKLCAEEWARFVGRKECAESIAKFSNTKRFCLKSRLNQNVERCSSVPDLASDRLSRTDSTKQSKKRRGGSLRRKLKNILPHNTETLGINLSSPGSPFAVIARCVSTPVLPGVISPANSPCLRRPVSADNIPRVEVTVPLDDDGTHVESNMIARRKAAKRNAQQDYSAR